MPGLNIVYRPASLEEVVGNAATKESLRTLFERDISKLPHSFLFTGKKGCGKTTFGYIIGSMLGVYNPDSDYNPDFRIVDASVDRGIGPMRQLLTDCGYSPVQSDYVVYMFDEAHGLTGEAQDALLRTLENPPSHAFFVLCTTDPQKLKGTIIDRCNRFEVSPLRYDELMQLLYEILSVELSFDDIPEPTVENIKERFPRAILECIVKKAEGCPRNALTLLDTVMDIQDEAVALKVLEETILSEANVREICLLLLDTKISAEDRFQKMKKMMETWKDMRGDNDPEKMRRGIFEYLTKVLFSSSEHVRVFSLCRFFVDTFMYTGEAGLRLALYAACNVK